jgi:hypothetical protein
MFTIRVNHPDGQKTVYGCVKYMTRPQDGRMVLSLRLTHESVGFEEVLLPDGCVCFVMNADGATVDTIRAPRGVAAGA